VTWVSDQPVDRPDLGHVDPRRDLPDCAERLLFGPRPGEENELIDSTLAELRADLILDQLISSLHAGYLTWRS
jgi:hypothetical protein